jgi:ferredoxin
VIFAVWACIASYFCYKFAKKIFEFETAFENAIDMIDASVLKIQALSSRHVLFDDYVTREVVHEIAETQKSLIVIARSLTTINETRNDERETK